MDRSEAENARRQVDEWIAEFREEAAQREAEQAASANADHAPVLNPGDTTPAAAECPPDPEPAKLVRAELSPSRAMLGTGLSKTCPSRKLDPDVMMVQSAENRQRKNAADRLDRPRQR